MKLLSATSGRRFVKLLLSGRRRGGCLLTRRILAVLTLILTGRILIYTLILAGRILILPLILAGLVLILTLILTGLILVLTLILTRLILIRTLILAGRILIQALILAGRILILTLILAWLILIYTLILTRLTLILTLILAGLTLILTLILSRLRRILSVRSVALILTADILRRFICALILGFRRFGGLSCVGRLRGLGCFALFSIRNNRLRLGLDFGSGLCGGFFIRLGGRFGFGFDLRLGRTLDYNIAVEIIVDTRYLLLRRNFVEEDVIVRRLHYSHMCASRKALIGKQIDKLLAFYIQILRHIIDSVFVIDYHS